MTATLKRRTVVKALAAIGIGAALLNRMPLAAAQTLADLKKKGELTVGMLVDFPPYGTLNASNQPDGYDADVARLLAEDLGMKLKLVPVTGPNRIPFLQSVASWPLISKHPAMTKISIGARVTNGGTRVPGFSVSAALRKLCAVP